MNIKEFIAEVKFDSQGLVPAVIQDYRSGEVLMVAYMNEEALRLTLEQGETHFFSRSRRKIWHKGETSGHVQKVREIRLDCDSDCLLVKVEQVGGASCHTGYRSCFFRRLDYEKGFVVDGVKVFDPEKVYGSTNSQ